MFGGISFTNVLLMKQAGPYTPPPTIPELSLVYFDQTDAPLGTVTSLTTRGSLGAVLSQVTTANQPALMTSDGLQLRGNTLRWSGTTPAYSKMRMHLDVTMLGSTVSGSGTGTLFTVNQNGAAEARFWAVHQTTGLIQIRAPQSVAPTFAAQPANAVGVRHVVSAEIDAGADVLRVIEADNYDSGSGFSGVYPTTFEPFPITRLEIGTNANAIIHRFALIVE